MKQALTDPTTGKIDLGVIAGGMSKVERETRLMLVSKIKELIIKRNLSMNVPINKIFGELKDNLDLVRIFSFFFYIFI